MNHSVIGNSYMYLGYVYTECGVIVLANAWGLVVDCNVLN